MDSRLANQQYVVVEGFIDTRLARILYDMLLIRHWRQGSSAMIKFPMQTATGAIRPSMRCSLGCCPMSNRHQGAHSSRPYSYARLYLQGQALPRHRDRAACEIAVTVHLGSADRQPPPLRFAPDVSVSQRPGDAVVYFGDRLEHWRESFEGTNFAQLFLNYVRADGERRCYVHDGRKSAFPPSISPLFSSFDTPGQAG